MYKVLYLLPALVALSLFASVETATAERTEEERTAKIDRQIDNLKERIKEIERKIHAYSLTANEWKIPRLEAKIESLKDRMAELEERKGDPTNHLQAKIDKLNERIAALETKRDSLDPATEQARIDKINDRIAILQEKIAKIEARMSTATPDPTDTTPPTLQSVTYESTTRVMTLTFDETIDVSDINWGLTSFTDGVAGTRLANAVMSESDSEIISITFSESEINRVGVNEDFRIFWIDGVSIPDVAGNALEPRGTTEIEISDAPS